MSELHTADAQGRSTVRWWPWMLLALAYLAGCGIALALGGDLHQQRVLASSATLAVMLIALGLAVARVDLELGPGERTSEEPFGQFSGRVMGHVYLDLAPALLALPAQAIGLAALNRVHALAAVCVAIVVPLGLLLPAYVGVLARLLVARAWLAGLLAFGLMIGLALLPFCCCLPMVNPPIAVYFMVDTYEDVKLGPESVLLAAVLTIPTQLGWTAPLLGMSAWVYRSRGRRARWHAARSGVSAGEASPRGIGEDGGERP